MIRIERKIGWYSIISAFLAPLWLLAGSTGFAPMAWVLGLSWAWAMAWFIMRRYEKQYRDAMQITLALMREHAKKLVDDEEQDELLNLINRTQDRVDGGAPVMKMNRWIGNIEGKLVAYGVVTDGQLGDQTRPFFRPLDFGR